jgi:hypothetical protein
VRVIPEHVMVVDQPGDWDGGPDPWDGFHVFMLNEHGGKSIVTVIMQHSIHPEGDGEGKRDFWSSEEAGGGAKEWNRKWAHVFIPKLKQLIYESS